MVTASESTSVLETAYSPVLGWLLIIAGLGVSIGVAVFVVRAGWDLLRDLIGGVDMSRWGDMSEQDDMEREHDEREEREFYRRNPSA